MSTYVTEDRCKYEIPDHRLDEAIEWIVENTPDKEPHHAAYRDGTSIVYPTVYDWFGGNVPYRWYKTVEEFMKRFCLPRSYATFRSDDEFAWCMAIVADNGSVEWESVDCGNPFEGKCDELEA